MKIDIEKLRSHLINYFGLASYYNPNAMIDIVRVQNATDEEIINIAVENNFKLEDFMIKGYSL